MADRVPRDIPDQEIKNRVGTRLRELRLQAGMTQQQLASAADLTTLTVGEIELGKRMPSVGTLEHLADALGITIIDFFGDTLEAGIG